MLEQAGSLDFSPSSVSPWDLHDGDELRGRQDHTQSRRQDVRCSRKQDGAMNGCCEDDAGRNVGPDQTRHTTYFKLDNETWASTRTVWATIQYDPRASSALIRQPTQPPFELPNSSKPRAISDSFRFFP